VRKKADFVPISINLHLISSNLLTTLLSRAPYAFVIYISTASTDILKINQQNRSHQTNNRPKAS
jgi:hypothetical protein